MKITIINSQRPATLTKHISRDASGSLVKTSSAHLTQGHAQTVDVTSMGMLNSVLDSLAPNQAIAYGTPVLDNVALVSEKNLADNPGAITRSDKCFSWPKQGGFLMLDYDPEAGEQALSQNDLIGNLFTALPALATSCWLWRPSASGNIYDAATGAEVAGLKGQRVYVAVTDAADIPRAGLVIFKRLWLAGYGRIEIAQNGAMLTRGMVDSSVWQPSRLDFAAGAVCSSDLVRRPPAGIWADAGLLDTKATLPDLTQAEEKQYLELVAAAKQRTAPRASTQRDTHINTVAQQQNVSPDEVRARYDVAEQKGILSNDFVIELAYDRGTITVAEILSDPSKYHNVVCLDPLEPEYNNRHPVGKIYNDSKGAFLDSKAHGGRIFNLGSISALIFQEQASGGDTFKDLMTDVRTDACDLAQVGELVERINSGPFCDTEITLLRAELEGCLKQDKRLTPELKAMIHDGKATTAEGPRARDMVPQTAHGQRVSMSMPINPSMWCPMQTSGRDEKPLGTMDNFRVMAGAYGVTIEFNEISKELTLGVPGHKQGGALQDESALNHMVSLANLNKYPKGDVPGMICSLAHENTTNPVRDMLESAKWDGQDHISALFAEIDLDPEEDAHVCGMLFRRWMRGAVACGTGYTHGLENALVWVDELGGAGKTRFFRTLCPEALRADGMTLDPSDKDSVKGVISHWLVELGELDGTFNKAEVAELKAFMSRQLDEIRLPYARTYSKFPRTTAFMASVNQINFLVDDTGNRRFWPIRVIRMNHMHTVNMQQAWAQAWVEVLSGQTWHLNEEENRLCAQRNKLFKSVSRVEDMLRSRVDLESEPTLHMTCSDLATAVGLNNAHKGELNEIARWLRDNGVPSQAKGGRRGFMFAPLRNPLMDPPNLQAVV